MIPLVNSHIYFLLIAGIALLGMFTLPALLKRSILTVPLIFVLFGFIVFSIPLDLPLLNLEGNGLNRQILEYVTEFIVIVSLAAIGIKIDRPPNWSNWKIGWYLLGIAMPLTIVFTAWAGYEILGLSLASAVLLGAVIAPTDPVLAGSVQVGPPQEGKEDHVRFGLTLEAGLNDGLAFPFVFLALNIERGESISTTLKNWIWDEFLLKITLGIVIGLIMGYLLSRMFFYLRSHLQERFDTEVKEGMFVIAAILITYSITECLYGYGFLAVFVAAVVARQHRSDHKIHQETYRSINQIEQAILGLFLLFYGGILALGGLSGLSMKHVAISLLIILIIRPISGLIAFSVCPLKWKEKIVISFFGIRGIGSLYYLAFAHNSLPEYGQIDQVWIVINFTILLSIAIHGLTADGFLKWLESKE